MVSLVVSLLMLGIQLIVSAVGLAVSLFLGLLSELYILITDPATFLSHIVIVISFIITIIGVLLVLGGIIACFILHGIHWIPAAVIVAGIVLANLPKVIGAITLKLSE